MAIKRKSAKKTTAKKTTTNKVKKPIIDTTPNDEMEAALDAIEEGAKQAVVNGDPSVLAPLEEIEEQLDSDDIPFEKTEDNSWNDPKVYEAKEDFKDEDDKKETLEIQKKIFMEAYDKVHQDPPMEAMNGDASVLTPTEEIEEEAMKETFKENKVSRKADNMFGYSWNGMEIDYIL